LACREEAIPITLKDIYIISTINMKEFTRTVRKLVSTLNIKNKFDKSLLFIHRLADSLTLTMRTRNVASNIILEAKKMRIVMGKHPISISTAALYIACNLLVN